MSTRKTPPSPAPAPARRWRIMVGEVELESYASEVMARKRWYELARTDAGFGSKLVHPDGKVEG